MTKYDLPKNYETEFELGSNNQVLTNNLHITSKEKIDEIEAGLLLGMEEWALFNYSDNHIFLNKDLCLLHKKWLGRLYSWAGLYRTVDLSKDNFLFAQARFIRKLMDEFESNYLKKYSPGKKYKSTEKLSEAIAITHVEFIIIHPFREGNGRLARILCNLLALQAGYARLNFSILNSKQYIDAIHQGLDKNYTLMTRLFSEILQDGQKK